MIFFFQNGKETKWYQRKLVSMDIEIKIKEKQPSKLSQRITIECLGI